MELRDKVALITGGSSGLGRATALALAAEGVEVVVADVDEAGGRAVAEQVGGHFVACDVSSFAANVALVGAAVDLTGGIDIAYLNAGVVTGFGIGPEFDVERYKKVMGINLDGVIYGTHAVLPALKARGGGAIVVTASLAGLTAVPFDPIYAASKAAVVGLARSLGPALAVDNVTYNAICPAFAESKIVEPIREVLAAQGVELIPAETVAATVLRIITGGATGEAWFVQPAREPAPFMFRNVPGPGKGNAARPEAI
ncbi:FabG-like 3-oxoacyl-(acyl-carrier-protein) reductase [Baekduia alba]|uniref:SDR family oxidoreductase n=1 Tax=Baekduia alba TaxID=2997333 RepID=UPI0023408706|nr:SDR family NAD(P)-dependent oxidoreductase [Baekduia alba]WCB96760.1 FabG-like 3-oxoacyl-(acyl-carrier-protein) reductase [Baekduia alba]